MAVAQVESVDSVIGKLRALLDKARKVKLATSIDPPLPGADVFGSFEGFRIRGDPTLVKGVIDSAARHTFYDILARTKIYQPEFVDMWNLLDILQSYEDHEQSSPALVLWLLEELLDSQNIEGCRRVFDYMESRREVLIASNFARNKDLVILRSCNELLRRLSRAEDAVFCGRVFIFMFLSFPLGDKSSVNPRGEFHVENVTTFEEGTSPDAHEEPQAMDVDTEPAGEDQNRDQKTADEQATATDEAKKKDGESETKLEPVKIDADALYPVFWSLQQAFANPARLFSQEALDEFKKGMEMTLQKFKQTQHVIAGDKSSGMNQKQPGEADDFASTFNPKYLTSRDLFRLELSDLAFQRHILVQALILIEFILSLTAKSKAKMAEFTSQKALRYAFTLSEQDADWASGVKRMIVNYLQEQKDGKFYYRMVEVVLSRDKNWVRWKLENCPAIKRAPASAEVFLEAKSGAHKTCTPKKLRATPMGSLDLAFLSDSQGLNGLAGLKAADRTSLPTPENLINGIQGHDLDLEMASTEQEKETIEMAKSNKRWRALRIASRDKLSRFDRIDDGKNLVPLTKLEPEADTEAEGEQASAEVSSDGVDADGSHANVTASSAEVKNEGPVAGHLDQGHSDGAEETRPVTSDQIMADAIGDAA